METKDFLRYFHYSHLIDVNHQKLSKRFHDLAHGLDEILPDCPQKTIMMMKLLEAKDCAVRAALNP